MIMFIQNKSVVSRKAASRIMMCSAGAWFLTGVAFAQPPERTTDVDVVEARVVDETARPGDPSREQEPQPSPPGGPISFRDVRPMPMPRALADDGDRGGPGLLFEYNSETGIETFLGETPPPADLVKLFGEWNAVAGGIGGAWTPTVQSADEDGGPGLGSWSLEEVSNPSSHPWRVNGKLFLHYPNDPPGAFWRCSAVLIDPLHVLTASHCVYNASRGGWYDEAFFVPAYDHGSEPYGRQRVVGARAWLNDRYRYESDFNHDMAVVRLDRHVGALTGWHGFGFHDSCSWWLGRVWNNPGYPGTGGFDGESMFQRYGSYDNCDTYQMHFNAPSFGGQSGSGSYMIDAGNRFVMTVLSHGGGGTSGLTRMTGNKFEHIRDFVLDIQPSQEDFLAMDTNASSTVQAGSRLGSMDYLVHNYSRDSYSGTLTVDVYLSTDENITQYDTFLQRHSAQVSLGSRGSVRITLSTPPTIPENVSPRNYFVGLIIQNSDADSSNNDSSGVDAAPVRVTAPPPPPVVTATIDGFQIRGKRLSGDIDSLRDSDDDRLRFKGKFRRRHSPAHVGELRVTLISPRTNARYLHLKIKSRISEAGGTSEIYLWNVSNGRWDRVRQYAIGATESTRAISSIPAAHYIGPDVGRIKVKIVHSKTHLRRGKRLKSYFDLVEVRVE